MRKELCALQGTPVDSAATRASVVKFDMRLTVIAEAESWLGTPYHHMARLKGVGCDCLTLLVAVYHAAGVIPAIEIPYYPPDWHLHRSSERYMEGLLAHASEVETPDPGDVALFKFGRCFAHGTIVTQWPRLIHAWNGSGVVRGEAHQPLFAGRAMRFFTPFEKNSPRRQQDSERNSCAHSAF
jgi:NlpC/P60 family putative phage cell wall peptidase